MICNVDDPLLPPTVGLIAERGMIQRSCDKKGDPLRVGTYPGDRDGDDVIKDPPLPGDRVFDKQQR